MFKKKNLWFSLAVAAMMLFGGSMTTYANEITAETEEEAMVSEYEETSKVIVLGEASANADAETSAEAISSEETDENAAHDLVHDGLQSLGIFRTTGYCPCSQCSEGWGRRTSTGAIAQSSHTIAVDPRVIPYGTKLMIGGVIYTAEDRGGGVKGNHIDIFFDNHAQTKQHGSRQQEVFLVS